MSGKLQHPPAEELVLAVLGELGEQRAAEVQAHLDACAECRAQVQELRATDLEFTAFYQTDFKPAIPPPPNAWRGFHEALQRQACAPASWFARLRSHVAGYLRPSRLVPMACALALVAIAVVRLSQTPTVSAAEILKRAVNSEQDSLHKVSRAAVYQKLRVRMGRTTLTRVVYRDVEHHRRVDQWTGADQAPAAASALLTPQLSAELQQARLDWDDPLSPAGIQRWLDARQATGQSREDVREEGDSINVTSHAPTGPVTEARFAFRASDCHPTAALYRFQARPDEIEFTEIAYEIRSLDSFDPAVRTALSAGESETAAAAATSSAVEGAPAGPAPEELEVQALYALHQHNADLGGETDVSRHGSAVKVAGVVESAQRKAELRSALAHWPNLQVELLTAQEAADRQSHAIASAAESPAAPAARVPALRDALAARFPDQSSRDSFVLEVLSCSQQALAHAFALQRLTKADAPGATLSHGARAEIQAMSADHLRELKRHLDVLTEQLAPLTGQPPGGAAADSRQSADIVPDLQKLDRVVTRLVGGPDGDSSDSASLIREYLELAGRVKQDLAQGSAGAGAR